MSIDTPKPNDLSLRLPITTDKFAEVLQSVGVDDPKECDIFLGGIKCNNDRLYNLLRDVEHSTLDTFTELNYLAAKCQELDEFEVDMFDTVLIHGEDIGDSIADFINIIENLHHYTYEPVDNAEELGEFIIESQFDWEMLNRLESSADPKEQKFAKDIALYIDHINKETLGQAQADKEKGVFTGHGYLTKKEDKIENVYHGINFIPAKYFILPDAEVVPSVKNTELTSLLIKMEALGGINQQEIGKILTMLIQDLSHHYHLLMTDSDMYIAPISKAYHNNSEAYNIWNDWAELPNIKAFRLDVHYRENEFVFGDLHGLNFKKQFDDIQAHKINLKYVEAALPDGDVDEYTLEDWHGLLPTKKEEYLGCHTVDNVYAIDDLNYYLSEISQVQGKNNKVLSSEDFLCRLNRSYMDQAENKHPGMLRVPHGMATELLARGNTAVYRMAKGSLKKLSSMNALKHKSGSWCKHYEFAVKRSAMKEIDKWAKRQRGAIVKKITNQRSMPDRPRKKGQER